MPEIFERQAVLRMSGITVPILWFSSFLAVVSATLVWLLRLPLEIDDGGLPAAIDELMAIVMVLAVVWSSQILRVVLIRAPAEFTTLFATGRFSIIFFLLFMPWILARLIPDGVWQVVTTAVLGATAAVGIYCGVRSPSSATKYMIGWSAIFAAIFAVALATSILDAGYQSPYIYELTLLGEQHRDTLFHAAIANMLEYHGKQSIGLDGFVPIGYHVLSHRLIGSLSHWIGVDVLRGYYIYFFIVGWPVLVTFLAEATMALRPKIWASVSPLAGLALLLCWLLIFGVFQFASYFKSESYQLSLVIALATVPVMASWLQEGLSVINRSVIAVALFAAVALASLAKISTGAVLFTGIVVLIIAHSGYRIMGFVTAFMVAVIPFGLVILGMGTTIDSSGILFSPFHFLFRHTGNGVFHVVLTVLILAYVVRNLPPAKDARFLVLSLSTMVVAALTSSMLLKFEGSAAYYFANPGMWFAILLFGMNSPQLRLLGQWDLNRQLAVVLAISLFVVLANGNRWRAIPRTLYSLSKIRNSASPIQTDRSTISISERLVSSTTLGRMHNRVAEIRKLSKVPTIIFVEPDFAAFWAGKEPCWAQPLAIPAITGYPMLMGLQPQSGGCAKSAGYGLNAYGLAESSSRPLNDRELCQKAASRGFKRILRFRDADGEVLDCQR